MVGDTQKFSKNRQTKCENKKKYGETSFDSFPVNSAPVRYLFAWKVILFLWCTQVKQKVVKSKILLQFIQVLRSVDSQEKAGQPVCSSNPRHRNRGFSPGGHKKNPNLTEQSGTTRCRPPSHRQTRPKGVERMKRELLQAVWPAWLTVVVQVMQYVAMVSGTLFVPHLALQKCKQSTTSATYNYLNHAAPTQAAVTTTST